MGVMIDSSVLIAGERGRLDLEAHVQAWGDSEFFLSVITVSELLHGVYRAVDAGQRARRSAFVESILATFPLLEIDVATARAHAGTWAQLQAAGEMIGQHDLWLAAACLAHGHTMVTANVRDFRRVPGLSVEVWEDVSL